MKSCAMSGAAFLMFSVDNILTKKAIAWMMGKTGDRRKWRDGIDERLGRNVGLS